MAISEYSELLTAIDNWMDRTDLTSREPEFIALFEARFNREMRTSDMMVRSDSYSISGQYTAAPDGFIQAKRLSLDTAQPRKLQYISPQEMAEKREYNNSTGEPKWYTVSGGDIEVLPSPDQAYTSVLLYYKRLDALTAVNTSNWLLESHPDIYLYGCLVEAEPYVKNDERLGVWKSLLDGKLLELKRSDSRAQVGDSPRMPIRKMGV